MPRARRLASTVVVAALAVTGLAACNQAPGVAVYFGDKKAVTEDEVQRVWDDSSAKLVPNATGQKVVPFDRQSIVNLEVEVAALRALGKQKGFTAAAVPATDLATLANQASMDKSAAFITLVAEFRGWETAAAQNTQDMQAVDVTDADLRDIYNRLKAAGSQNTYEEFSASVTDDVRQQQIAPGLGLRNELAAESKSLNIKINPRYTAPVLGLLTTTDANGNSVNLVDVQLGTGAQAAPVEDLS
jgi:hypothetical protein